MMAFNFIRNYVVGLYSVFGPEPESTPIPIPGPFNNPQAYAPVDNKVKEQALLALNIASNYTLPVRHLIVTYVSGRVEGEDSAQLYDRILDLLPMYRLFPKVCNAEMQLLQNTILANIRADIETSKKEWAKHDTVPSVVARAEKLLAECGQLRPADFARTLSALANLRTDSNERYECRNFISHCRQGNAVLFMQFYTSKDHFLEALGEILRRQSLYYDTELDWRVIELAIKAGFINEQSMVRDWTGRNGPNHMKPIMMKVPSHVVKELVKLGWALNSKDRIKNSRLHREVEKFIHNLRLASNIMRQFMKSHQGLEAQLSFIQWLIENRAVVDPQTLEFLIKAPEESTGWKGPVFFEYIAKLRVILEGKGKADKS